MKSFVMHFSIVINLSFNLLFCGGVRPSAQYSLSENQTLFNNENDDTILEKFFVELKKYYLPKLELRQITIVGTLNDHIKQVTPLFQSYPCIVCSDSIKCAYEEGLSRGNYVIIFLDDLSGRSIEKNIEILSKCRKCGVLFISHGIVNIDDIWSIFVTAMNHNVPYAEYAHLEKDEIQLYNNFYTTNCSVEVRVIVVWKPGIPLRKIHSWAFRLKNLNKCPVLVSSLTFKPKMIITERKNGSLTVSGGREGKLLSTLATKLNFTIILNYPSLEDQLNYSRKVAILYDVAYGNSEIGIGRLRPTNKFSQTIRFSLPYDDECVTWGVPRVMNWSTDIIWVEFSSEVWLSVGLVFGIGCLVGYIHRNIILLRTGAEKNHQGFVTIILDAVAIHLGNPVVYVSSSTVGRFMLIVYLYYSMVITTAYKTSLASILATDEVTPTIYDAQGIIDANLSVGGSFYDYGILKDQISESKHSLKLLERFVINNNGTQTWNQLRFDNDYAFLARRSSLAYERQLILKAHEPVTFNVFNNCVLAYHTVIAFKKKSYLRKPVDDIILRLSESGILEHWDIDEIDSEKLLKHKSAEKYFEKRAAYKFRNIFALYAVCITLCLITFFTELLTRRLLSIRLQLFS